MVQMLRLGVLVLVGCAEKESPRLRILWGSTMAAPMQELAKQFTQETGLPVEFDLGGSETVLPKILAGAPADIYVCHDPFEEKVKTAQRWASSVLVGYLQPVVTVRPGNPKQVRSLADLQRADLKLGIGDPRYSTCGELFVQALQQLEPHFLHRVLDLLLGSGQQQDVLDQPGEVLDDLLERPLGW